MSRRWASKRERAPWALLLVMLAVYLLAAWIEPCDGHSCTRAEQSAVH